jgi:hypothetical protein
LGPAATNIFVFDFVLATLALQAAPLTTVNFQSVFEFLLSIHAPEL